MTQQPGQGLLWDGVLSAIHSPGGARPDEPCSEQLQRVVSRHIAAEESSISRYKVLLSNSKDTVIRMLFTELIADETHHHDLLKRMEVQLEAELGERERQGHSPARPTNWNPLNAKRLSSNSKTSRATSRQG
jgi:rubrerythrin